MIDDDLQPDLKTEQRLEQHARTLTPTANKSLREKLADHVKSFLQSGGKITKVETGVTAGKYDCFVKPIASPENQRNAQKGRKGRKHANSR